ncbi:YggS family pyridoxal phosphate-dependent enzyme [Aeromicrobium phragmitis]|uniref:Pyridoxal phosphate homeostasis protein n=1 Tax=Aeromicrobium phragmitis TaxID=2478914 RepID=A0A3L8PL33_9ACTN|nr:YggS family pyridoxal phosphate-dependent enzyme [Aeromicrobium phragmitis]RLV55914.1 YggS family pyridoxal phosphate-dependent enzyme [Aeromicrobium phragmitis]
MTRRAELAARLEAVEQQIAQACAAAGRERDEITLVAITKTYPASDVALLADLGVTDVGENRHPEARDKLEEFEQLLPAGAAPPRMHFVGGLQTNKAGAVARYADVVHSVDRPKLARSLARGAEAAGRVLDCLVQIDFGGDDAGRAGVLPEGVDDLADLIAASDSLRLRGVMTVAPLGQDPEPHFAHLAEIAERIRTRHETADIISAGMSGDFAAAVRHGATHLRIGRSILGERPPLQ